MKIKCLIYLTHTKYFQKQETQKKMVGKTEIRSDRKTANTGKWANTFAVMAVVTYDAFSSHTLSSCRLNSRVNGNQWQPV